MEEKRKMREQRDGENRNGEQRDKRMEGARRWRKQLLGIQRGNGMER